MTDQTVAFRHGGQPAPVLTDPRLLKIRSTDNGEPLVDLEASGVPTTIHARVRSVAPTRFQVRAGLIERLREVNALLAPRLRVAVVEGHRPMELQLDYWEEDLEALRRRHADWDMGKLTAHNARFVAPPWIDPPHTTGGAVDVILLAAGEPVDMGSQLNEEGDLMATDASGVSPTARHNRDLLRQAMEETGFINYPYEWWHYSYGDRYWALAVGEGRTEYRPVAGSV